MSTPLEASLTEQSAELKRTAIWGSAWLLGARFIQQFLALAKIIVLARLLSQEEFGRFGIAMIVFSAVEILSYMGIHQVLIQKKGEIRDWLPTAFTLQLIRAIIGFTALYLAAPWIAGFFGDPESTTVIRSAALLLPLSAMVNPILYEVMKRVDYRRLVGFQLSAVLVDFAVTIVLVAMNPTALSVVYGVVAGKTAALVYTYFFHSYRPAFGFSLEKAREFFRRGKWFFLVNVQSYIHGEIGGIATGRLLGVGALGAYGMAMRLAFLPIYNVSQVLNQVFYPIMVEVRDDKTRLRGIVIRYMTVTGLMAYPVGVVLFFFSPLLVEVVLSERWAETAPLLQVFSLLLLPVAINSVGSVLAHAVERTYVYSAMMMVRIMVVLACIVPFVDYFGAPGVIYAAIAGEIATLPYTLYKLVRYSHGRAFDLLLPTFLPLMGLITGFGFTAYPLMILLAEVDPALRLLSGLAAGIITSVVILALLERIVGLPMLTLLLDIIHSLRPNRSTVEDRS